VSFTVTHPFHPDFGHTFVLLSRRKAWGEWRVCFHDPQTHLLRSLPVAWTTLAPADPVLAVAQGRTVLRFLELQHLAQFLRARLAQQGEEEC
jgi:hypothetical protein